MPKPRIKPAKSLAAVKPAQRGSSLPKVKQAALAEQGRQALADITTHTATLERAERMTRDAWLAYGRVLLAYRDSLPDDPEDQPITGSPKSNQAFAHWVRENGLNVGPAMSPSVRSNALWLARTWPEIERVLQRVQDGGFLTATHPTAIRRQWLSFEKMQDRGDVHFGAGPQSYHAMQDKVRELRWSVETISSTVKSLEADHMVSPERLERARAAMRELARLWAHVESHLKAHPELIDMPRWERLASGLK